MTDPAPPRLAHASLHARLVRAGACCEVLLACFLITGPLFIPDFPLAPKFLWISVPIAFQRTATTLMGTAMLVEGVLLMSLSPYGWWVSMLSGPIAILDGLLTNPRFWTTLLDILLFFYLYYVRDVFFTPPAPKA